MISENVHRNIYVQYRRRRGEEEGTPLPAHQQPAPNRSSIISATRAINPPSTSSCRSVHVGITLSAGKKKSSVKINTTMITGHDLAYKIKPPANVLAVSPVLTPALADARVQSDNMRRE